MIGKAVAGMTIVERPHHRIACDFRKNGGRGDAGGFGVALDNCLLRDIYLLQTLRVDQEVLRRGPQPLDRSLHRQQTCPIRAIESNIDRYQGLLKSNLSDIEIRFVERRLSEERFALAIEQSMSSGRPSKEGNCSSGQN
jgi:hypothetical protein